MIVGAYTLDLYCRNHQVSQEDGQHACVVPAWKRHASHFNGANERQARARARAAGWVFNRGDVLCPECARGGVNG